MGTVEENLKHWKQYDWSKRGEEWSELWGGSGNQWAGAIRPRIASFVPCGTILEIACGYGRWSEHLVPLGQKLQLVDLFAGAVEACAERFRDAPHVRCFQTDGRSLPMAADRSIDFVFSFDSLVHCELPEMECYLAEIARTLKPEGVAFLHHSNMAAVLAERPGTHNRHWRAESVAASEIARKAGEAGLLCAGQEIVDWGVEASDCLSILVRPDSAWGGEPVVAYNAYFMAEAHSIRLRSSVQPGKK